MTEQDNNDPFNRYSLGAVMSGEGGDEELTTTSPIRVTGIICLVLSLFSVLALIEWRLIGIGALSLIFGAIALRKTRAGEPPVGTLAAKLGISIALLFSFWGGMMQYMKQETIGGQAEHFGREYIRLAALGEKNYLRELQKEHQQRYGTNMDLDARYAAEAAEAARLAAERGGANDYDDFSETVSANLMKYPEDMQWHRYAPILLHTHYGRLMADVYFANGTGPNALKIKMTLEYSFNREDGGIEWRVDAISEDQKALVAESIL
ncbi:hypothetical protein SV7mr_52910 [Stieleria bergensis]|uniref:Uncharacterized protein n=1 Tax=Stieleria bergensis TaxID=2528025 RepID=A0A517T2Z1_9BACT|nr:hypothetical protein SV7mr_52910 [Planctomycetes bacterium SV_7m_r]